jgi:hypothetical protein
LGKTSSCLLRLEYPLHQYLGILSKRKLAKTLKSPLKNTLVVLVLVFLHLLNVKKTLCIVSVVLLVSYFSVTSFVNAAPVFPLNPTNGPPGTVVQVTGSGFTPNGDINADLWNGTSAYTFSADSSGNLNTTETVPPVDPGTYRFVVTDASTGGSTTTQFVVTESTSASPTPTTSSSASETPAPSPSVPEFPVVTAMLMMLFLGSAIAFVGKKHL